MPTPINKDPLKVEDLDIDAVLLKLKEILSDGYIFMMYESFTVIMHSNAFKSVSKLTPFKSPENVMTNEYALSWVKLVDDRMLATHNNANQTTDFAAMLISLCVLEKIQIIKEQCKINELRVETSATGSGIDFWISDKDDPLDFRARIEISGIRQRSDTNNLAYRANKKSKQVLKFASTLLPAYISLIEFSQLEVYILKR